MIKEDFASILEKAILASVTPEVVANGFKSIVLHLLDSNAIKNEKYFKPHWYTLHQKKITNKKN